MKPVRVAGIAAATTALTLSGIAAAATSSSAAVMSHALPGAAALKIQGAVDHGTAIAATRSVTLSLQQRNTAALARRLASHAAPLSSADWMASYAPAQSSVDAVKAFATAHALTADVPANRAFVRLTGTQAAMQSALGVTYHAFTAGKSSYTATVGTATLPASVTAVTKSITGLSSAGHVGLAHVTPKAASGLNFEYGPQGIADLYDAPASATGAGQRVAVIAEGELSGVRADLATFEDHFGLPHVAWNQIQVGAASTDTAGAGEYDLDTQYSTGEAPNVSGLDVYDGTSLSNDDVLATINRWVSDNASRQASFSAGECELLAGVTGFTDSLDAVLAQAAAQGQSLFVSTGDNGGYCSAVVNTNGVPGGAPGVEYPSSSPYSVAVGGTTVVGTGVDEISWIGGGGGHSLFEDTPAYQANAGGSFTGLTRGVPDVALDADPNTGYDVIVNGAVEVIGGTSASAPAWQGFWARAQGAHGGSLGNANPVLYAAPAGAFNDITVGTNGLYPATPGYDYTTGRGTPNVAALISSIG